MRIEVTVIINIIIIRWKFDISLNSFQNYLNKMLISNANLIKKIVK